MVALKPLRCAVYTRKSTDEGLDQNFNSIDAQREACLAYITSQKSEGWSALKNKYDDGGFSGGNIERPALQQLMKDISARKVDIIVVYKIDRLTRSLWDFVKLAALFEKHNVTFVSITQSFNTTTSMGRLTMNILLSFAQFEREITSERIRDKFAASKKKGIWMGGTTPTGYDVKDRQLIPNEQAGYVREVFELYLKLGDLGSLGRYLRGRGVTSPVRTRTNGTKAGGNPISTGMVRHMLMNPIYIGKIRHRKEIYPGLQPPIISMELWEKVQTKLHERSVTAKLKRSFAGNPRLLQGKLFDTLGNKYTPVRTTNRHRMKYRYYALTIPAKKYSGISPCRLTDHEIENHVYDTLQAQLKDPVAVGEFLKLGPAENPEVLQFISSNREKLIHLNHIVDKVIVDGHQYTIELQPRKLCQYIDGTLSTGIATVPQEPVLKISAPFKAHNISFKTTVIDPCKEGDIELIFDMRKASITNLVRGIAWREEHFKRKMSLGEIAKHYGVSRGLVEKLILESFDKALRPYFSFS